VGQVVCVWTLAVVCSEEGGQERKEVRAFAQATVQGRKRSRWFVDVIRSLRAETYGGLFWGGRSRKKRGFCSRR
jgi:hypothetical protein